MLFVVVAFPSSLQAIKHIFKKYAHYSIDFIIVLIVIDIDNINIKILLDIIHYVVSPLVVVVVVASSSSRLALVLVVEVVASS